MDIFEFHRDVVDDYAEYVQSFIDVRDDRIREKVDEELKSGRLWPDPLIQFNPAYREAASIESLCAEGTLEPPIQDVFAGFKLYEHQVAALRLGSEEKDFVVTSGTGSGKSLTFLGTIFNHVLRTGAGPGVRAIIVYPMNALINSQWQEIDKYREGYEKSTGREFPITFAQYTGQEGKDKKQEVREKRPHILLTNYMMMELIMTRQQESGMRESLRDSLRFLVYDELHTYRGRQGSDVAMLNRRIKEHASNPLVCIGTSATMASGQGSLAEQKVQVAEVASKIFGGTITAGQVIGESLMSQFNGLTDAKALRSALEASVSPTSPQGELLANPIATWLEKVIGLEKREGILVRRKPTTLARMAEELSEATGGSEDQCLQKIKEILLWVEAVNRIRESAKAKPLLPFKLHQFIAQTGSVFVTLEDRASREITLDAGYFIRDDGIDKPIFPVALSRHSGMDFLCVLKDDQRMQLRPREFGELPRDFDDEDDEASGAGYILVDIPGEVFWDPESDLENLPEAWLNRDKAGRITGVKKSHREKLPKRVYFDSTGTYATTGSAGLPHKGWYLPARLPMDPTSGIVYNSRSSEYSKLARLGSEARSTSTSVISRSVVLSLGQHDAPGDARKLLSFTDNRQDASLQAGHFNDFNQVVQLRSAIYRAVKNTGGEGLDVASLGSAVFDALGLPQIEFARSPKAAGGFGLRSDPNEEAFKLLLFYRAVYDLRRAWRVVLPNLEQVGLVEIGYQDLDLNAENDGAWSDFPGFKEMTADRRAEVLGDLLDYLRSSYVIDHVDLEPSKVEENTNLIRNAIRAPWGLDTDERIRIPAFARLQPYKGRSRLPTVSIGHLSQLGRYLRQQPELAAHLKSKTDYHEYLSRLLDALEGVYISRDVVKSDEEDLPVYRLNSSTLRWKVGEGQPRRDRVRLRSYKALGAPRANEYFRRIYSGGKPPSLRGQEHTGQVSTEKRQEAEADFRNGRISTLFCSPTMELGIDIADLSVVHMRNAPPSPANYAQRSGRAGRSGQAALVVTYCANGSPHDRHYFQHSTDMVAGVVTPPRIDLSNEELLRTHLHAVYMAEVGLQKLDESVADLVDLSKPAVLPLREEIEESLHLSAQQKAKVRARFESILSHLHDGSPPAWFSESWVDDMVNSAAASFSSAFDRWRTLYQAALRQKEAAQKILDNPMYKASSQEKKLAKSEEAQARRQLDLLRNDVGRGQSQSEFFPFRYLAAEGYLPGYNFPRLPIRAFMQDGDSGSYVSRPKMVAIREFGPRNLIYHQGSKYEVRRQQTADLDLRLQPAKISLASGYFCMGKDYNLTNCPLTQAPLSNDGDRRIYPKLLELSEVRADPRENITCEEEERSRLGYDLQTFVSVDGAVGEVQVLDLMSGDQRLLSIRFIPTARLYQVNAGWRRYREKGFVLHTKTGFWSRSPKVEVTEQQQVEDPVAVVQLYTSDVADALYVHPSSALGLDVAGVRTLQYAFEKAIGEVFGVERGEIQSSLMGEQDVPNMLIYEAAEGSLGVLSQVVESPNRFVEVVEAAWRICHFELTEHEQDELPPASYDDLLSYYNQPHHADLDRRLIRDALEQLQACTPVLRPKSGLSYEEQYQSLCLQADPNSKLELDFLKHLYERRLRLPDKAQWRVPGLYIMPDFFYEPNVAVFVDGSPHDSPRVREDDTAKRKELKRKGYRVVSWHYSQALETVLQANSDIFSKVSA